VRKCGCDVWLSLGNVMLTACCNGAVVNQQVRLLGSF
jgi:hypothetical protein